MPRPLLTLLTTALVAATVAAAPAAATDVPATTTQPSAAPPAPAGPPAPDPPPPADTPPAVVPSPDPAAGKLNPEVVPTPNPCATTAGEDDDDSGSGGCPRTTAPTTTVVPAPRGDRAPEGSGSAPVGRRVPILDSTELEGVGLQGAAVEDDEDTASSVFPVGGVQAGIGGSIGDGGGGPTGPLLAAGALLLLATGARVAVTSRRPE